MAVAKSVHRFLPLHFFYRKQNRRTVAGPPVLILAAIDRCTAYWQSTVVVQVLLAVMGLPNWSLAQVVTLPA